MNSNKDNAKAVNAAVAQTALSGAIGALISPAAVQQDGAEGLWDHIIVIELTRFNVQHDTEENMINLRRTGQPITRNGWIEHGEYPDNLSSGQ